MPPEKEIPAELNRKNQFCGIFSPISAVLLDQFFSKNNIGFTLRWTRTNCGHFMKIRSKLPNASRVLIHTYMLARCSVYLGSNIQSCASSKKTLFWKFAARHLLNFESTQKTFLVHAAGSWSSFFWIKYTSWFIQCERSVLKICRLSHVSVVKVFKNSKKKKNSVYAAGSRLNLF